MSWEQAVLSVAGIFVILEGFNIISNAIKNYRNIRKPADDRISSIETAIGNQQKELDLIKQQILIESERSKKSEEALGIIVQCLFSILNHEITGNSVDGLKRSQEQLTHYLTTERM